MISESVYTVRSFPIDLVLKILELGLQERNPTIEQ
jgi:hypothetical protein